MNVVTLNRKFFHDSRDFDWIIEELDDLETLNVDNAKNTTERYAHIQSFTIKGNWQININKTTP